METLNRLREQFRPQEPIHIQELINECDDRVAQDDNYLKSISANRSYTDVPFLILQGVVLFVLAILLGYCIINGDIDRLIKGYDDCGNVCGKNNNFVIKYRTVCKAQDMSDKPFLRLGDVHRKCVQSCDGETTLSGYQCILKKNQAEGNSEKQLKQFLSEFIKNLHRCVGEIIGLCAVALGFAFVVLLMLRYLTGAFVWFSMLGVLLLFVGVTAFYANMAATTESHELAASAIPAAIVFGIFSFAMIIIIVAMTKRIELIIQLFKEAGKSITTMPILLVQPLLTFVCLVIIWSFWFYFTLWVQSAGTPEELLERVTFQPNTLTYTITVYNLFIMLWMVQFAFGCQNMIIAGAVSTWYFTKDKCKLSKPIFNSAYNTIKYHLGTISVTSLIIAVIQLVRIMLMFLRRFVRAVPCILYCVNYVERWMKYFTKNSLIITAIRGYAFREAGSRAFKLIVENVLQLLAISAIGDFVLILAKILVTFSTIGIGHVMIQHKNVDNQWALLILIGIMAYMIAHCFFSVYELAIDTIFICFCEDWEANNGVETIYFMSRDLMEFIEKSKVVLKLKVDKNQKVTTSPVVTV